MTFIENDFTRTIEERKEICINNFIELKEFIFRHKKTFGDHNFNLLGYLYNTLGFKEKKKIIKIMSKNT